ncbi:hypothetical protein BgiBS90_008350 [Biomphalaria glabrata]|nr:hypothetical protein BgiBS90_008350 [Biomphalaria glabrata]
MIVSVWPLLLLARFRRASLKSDQVTGESLNDKNTLSKVSEEQSFEVTNLTGYRYHPTASHSQPSGYHKEQRPAPGGVTTSDRTSSVHLVEGIRHSAFRPGAGSLMNTCDSQTSGPCLGERFLLVP